MERWPNFFIVGAPKAGTTSLYEYLKDVPGIYFPSIKEPSYFSYLFKSHKPLRKSVIRNKDEYLKLYQDAKEEKILGDASPAYLSVPGVAQEIYNKIPDAKILISLRDPVERFFSAYLMHYRLGNFQLSFHAQLENVMNDKDGLGFQLRYRGLYFEGVKRYLDIFSPKHVKIIIFEEWVKNPKNVITEILKFLEVEGLVYNLVEEVHNPFVAARGSFARYIIKNNTIKDFAQKHIPSSVRSMLREHVLTKKQEKPQMTTQDRKTLVDFYKDDVRKLENLLGRKLPWKNFQSLNSI